MATLNKYSDADPWPELTDPWLRHLSQAQTKNPSGKQDREAQKLKVLRTEPCVCGPHEEPKTHSPVLAA